MVTLTYFLILPISFPQPKSMEKPAGSQKSGSIQTLTYSPCGRCLMMAAGTAETVAAEWHGHVTQCFIAMLLSSGNSSPNCYYNSRTTCSSFNSIWLHRMICPQQFNRWLLPLQPFYPGLLCSYILWQVVVFVFIHRLIESMNYPRRVCSILTLPSGCPFGFCLS